MHKLFFFEFTKYISLTHSPWLMLAILPAIFLDWIVYCNHKLVSANDLKWTIWLSFSWKRSMKMTDLKPRPNDPNMPTQHIPTLLGATCCVRLATMLRHVGCCWVLLAQIWPFSNLSQQHPTCRNTSQHGGQTHTTCCAQQCWDMLR